MSTPRWTAVRDAALWIAGMALLGHETLMVLAPRWELLLVATAMLGLPGTLRGDAALAKPLAPAESAPPSPPA